MKLFRFNALVLFLAAAAFCGPVWAGPLEGIVFDPSGKAIAGAEVALTRLPGFLRESRTDSRGAYRFEDVPDGIYQLSANAHALSAPPIEVEIQGMQGGKQDIHLKISAISSKVVVSAALSPAPAPLIGSSVDVVSRQDIDDRRAQNALDVVRGVAGVEINQSGRRGGVTSAFIRGGESKYTAVMVDGIPLNEFGGAFDLASLPADGIERVEITRGPQSALYGSNAVTGVINIISRKGELSPRFTALAEGGSYSTRRFATGGSGLTRGLSWSYSLSRLDSEGVVANDNYRNQSAYLSLGFAPSRRRQFDFHFFGNANHNGAPGPYGSDPNNLFYGIDTISRGKQNLFAYQLGYVEKFSSRFRQVTTVNLATNDLYYRSSWGDYRSDNLRGILNTRSEIILSSTNSLSAGFEFNREQVRHTYITDSQNSPFLLPRTSLAYFVEDHWNLSKRLYLIAGVRFDNLRTHSIPPDAWGSRPSIPADSIVKINPRLSAAYIARESASDAALNGTRIHGSFGTGIRPPDGFELAFTNNPSLKPEKSVSFDAGVEQTFLASRAAVDLTYFFNRFEDQIVTLGGSVANLSSYTSDNLKNTRAHGIELSFRTYPVQSLELGGQYTFLDSSILALDGSSRALDPYEVGQELVRRPRHSAAFNITWRFKRLTLNTSGNIRGAVLDVDPSYGLSACSYGMPCFFRNRGYTRVDAGFSYKIAYGVEIYGRLNNLLNQKYEETFGYPALGANFMAGMKFDISTE